MKHQYIIIKYTNSWKWEEPNLETICIASDEETAKKIVAWLVENDERYDEENITYEYYYYRKAVVETFESFVEWYDN